VFALLATEQGGELQLAGFDPSAAVAGKVDFIEMSLNHYTKLNTLLSKPLH
jgi:hypothetical protein